MPQVVAIKRPTDAESRMAQLEMEPVLNDAIRPTRAMELACLGLAEISEEHENLRALVTLAETIGQQLQTIHDIWATGMSKGREAAA